MPVNAVVDASVLVSAFLFPGSLPSQVLTLAADGLFTMHLSPVLIEETRRSLLNKRLIKEYGHDEGAVLAWCSRLGRIAIIVSGPMPDIGRVCRDPDDDHVIAAAVAVNADVIVTGDNDLLTLGRFHGIRTLAPRGFVAEILPT